MTLREALLEQGKDLNITRLEIDKNADFHGRPATKVTWHMDSTGGRVQFEGTITNDLSLPAEEKAKLLIANARHQANNFNWDMELEI